MKIELVEDAVVFRVGRAPDPWAFSEPRFSGKNRWDDLLLWAIFERPEDAGAISSCLSDTDVHLVDTADPDLSRAMALNHLTWG